MAGTSGERGEEMRGNKREVSVREGRVGPMFFASSYTGDL